MSSPPHQSEDTGVQVHRCGSACARVWDTLHQFAMSGPSIDCHPVVLRDALQEDPGAAACRSADACLSPLSSSGAAVRLAAGQERLGAPRHAACTLLPGQLAILRPLQSPAIQGRRFAVVGGTWIEPAQKRNRFAELSEVRLFDENGVNVAASADIKWLLPPSGNTDVRALVNGVLWPKESFASWVCPVCRQCLRARTHTHTHTQAHTHTHTHSTHNTHNAHNTHNTLQHTPGQRGRPDAQRGTSG